MLWPPSHDNTGMWRWWPWDLENVRKDLVLIVVRNPRFLKDKQLVIYNTIHN
jgi:hypothetical protein